MENNLGFIHPRFDAFVVALELLKEGASAVSDAARRRYRSKKPARGRTLRAGVSTPLWNALAVGLNAQCKKRGDKARLARFIGLPRQRLNDFLKGKGPLPDAERTLMLFQWLVARRQAAGTPPRKNKKSA